MTPSFLIREVCWRVKRIQEEVENKGKEAKDNEFHFECVDLGKLRDTIHIHSTLSSCKYGSGSLTIEFGIC